MNATQEKVIRELLSGAGITGTWATYLIGQISKNIPQGMLDSFFGKKKDQHEGKYNSVANEDFFSYAKDFGLTDSQADRLWGYSRQYHNWIVVKNKSFKDDVQDDNITLTLLAKERQETAARLEIINSLIQRIHDLKEKS